MEEIIKVHRMILSSALRIEKLKKYIGKRAEVTIHIKSDEPDKVNSAAGYLKKYAQASINMLEKNAWLIAVKEKHDYR